MGDRSPRWRAESRRLIPTGRGPDRAGAPGRQPRLTTSTYLCNTNVPFSHPSGGRGQKDGRKVRSCDELPLTLGLAARLTPPAPSDPGGTGTWWRGRFATVGSWLWSRSGPTGRSRGRGCTWEGTTSVGRVRYLVGILRIFEHLETAESCEKLAFVPASPSPPLCSPPLQPDPRTPPTPTPGPSDFHNKAQHPSRSTLRSGP